MAVTLPTLDPFTLAMQAAGAIYSIRETKSQQKLIKMGRQAEQAAFESNMAAANAQYAESSLQAMQALRENVANQIAINAARGVQSGQGSAAASIRKSEQTFASDEKARRMNLLAAEAHLRAGDVLSGLHTLQSETQLGQSLTAKLFNQLPVSTLGDVFGVNKAVKKFGKNISKSVSASFGLDSVEG
jgi:hypothetical protein